MKLRNGKVILETSGMEEHSFGIKDENMGIILEMLRSRMYRDPIGSICREIASNSRDANREVSHGGLPIEIGFNNSIIDPSDLVISFKDNGPGISPDRMVNVFCSYAESTKRDTNRFTGGFGLGAKTPFSYSDNFAIETVVDKVKYLYVAAIDETQKGKIILLSKNDTDEENGTNIMIPIKREDRPRFEKAVHKATTFWRTRPKYYGFDGSVPTLNILTKEDKFQVVKHEGLRDLNFSDHFYALIDGILYELDRNICSWARMGLTDHLILLEFNNGELTVSANRETLQYDDRTISKLNQRLTEVKERIIKIVKEEVEKAPTYFAACCKYSMYTGAGTLDNKEDKYFRYLTEWALGSRMRPEWEWQGKKLVHNLDLKGHSVKCYEYNADASKKNRKFEYEAKTLSGYWLNTPIYYFDAPLSTQKRKALYNNVPHRFIIIAENALHAEQARRGIEGLQVPDIQSGTPIPPTDPRYPDLVQKITAKAYEEVAQIRKDELDLLKEWGCPEWKLTSSVVPMKREKREKKVRVDVEIPFRDGSYKSTWILRNNKIYQYNNKIKATYCYVVVKSQRDHTHAEMMAKRKADQMQQVIKGIDNVVTISEKYAKLIVNVPNLIPHDQLAAKIDRAVLQKVVDTHHIITKMEEASQAILGRYAKGSLDERLALAEQLDIPIEMKNKLTTLTAIQGEVSHSRLYCEWMESEFGITPNPLVHELVDLVKSIFAEVTLLKHIFINSHSEKELIEELNKTLKSKGGQNP